MVKGLDNPRVPYIVIYIIYIYSPLMDYYYHIITLSYKIKITYPNHI